MKFLLVSEDGQEQELTTAVSEKNAFFKALKLLGYELLEVDNDGEAKKQVRPVQRGKEIF